MTRALPPIILRLIPRLASPFDNEVVATARAIERTLKSQKLDWHDVAETVVARALPTEHHDESAERHESEHQHHESAEHHDESTEAAYMRAWLQAVARVSWLNPWTTKFVGDLLRRPNLDDLTDRQEACAKRIIRQAHDRGVRVDWRT